MVPFWSLYVLSCVGLVAWLQVLWSDRSTAWLWCRLSIPSHTKCVNTLNSRGALIVSLWIGYVLGGLGLLGCHLLLLDRVIHTEVGSV